MTDAARSLHRELPLPQPPSWAGYWTFVTSTIVLAFVLFLAKRGSLGTWIGFLSWSSPQPVATANDAAKGSGTPVGTVAGVPGVTTLSPGATGVVGGPGGTEVLNPGPPANPSGIFDAITNWFKPYTGGR